MHAAERLQSVIGDDLFPTVQHVSDVKQVLEFMEHVAQPVREEQLRAIILLGYMGENKRLHGDENPYQPIIEKILDQYKKAVAPVEVYLDTIEELIPKPPKPIILAEKEKKLKKEDD